MEPWRKGTNPRRCCVSGESEAQAAGKWESACRGTAGRGDGAGFTGMTKFREDDEIPREGRAGFPWQVRQRGRRGDRGCTRCSREGTVWENCTEGSDRCRAVWHGNAFTRELLKARRSCGAFSAWWGARALPGSRGALGRQVRGGSSHPAPYGSGGLSATGTACDPRSTTSTATGITLAFPASRSTSYMAAAATHLKVWC